VAERRSVRCLSVEFALLGPLEVRRDGEAIPLRRGRPRVLLVSLLLRVGRVVPSDVLIEEVWGEHPLLDAANALQGQVSYLRRVLGFAPTGPAPGLRTAAGGYVLDVDPDWSTCTGSHGSCRRPPNGSKHPAPTTPRLP
jgi:DNA-binding SARP family transcriptional activator